MSNKPSLLKQIAGAVIGGSLGLLIYSGYQVTSPAVTAWLTIPQKNLASNGQGARLSKRDNTGRAASHFEARAKEIAQDFGAAYKNYQITDAAPDVAMTSSAASVSSVAEDSTDVIPFEGATEGAADSSISSAAASSETSSEWTESDRAKAVREMWNDDAIEKAPGPDTDALPDSGIGVLGALVAAGAGAGGLRARKRN